MTGGADKLLEQAYEQFQFSTRAYHKILKTARTIADMESSEKDKGRTYLRGVGLPGI